MQKSPLRPLRLVHLSKTSMNHHGQQEDSRDERRIGYGEGAGNDKNSMLEKPATMLRKIAHPETRGEVEARELLKRTPHNYLFNQIYGFWLYISLFLFTLILTHHVPTKAYGTYAAIQTAINTISYIVALGLEDAIVTFVPRVFVEHGQAATARLVRRMLGLRLLILIVGLCIIIFGLPVLAALVDLIPAKHFTGIAESLNGPFTSFSASLHDPVLRSHTLPIAAYVLGSGIANLLMALCAALMRMKRVLIVGGATQLALLGLGYIALTLGWGINGVLWMQAIAALVGAAAFLFWFAPLLLTRGAKYNQPLKPMIQLGLSAWVTNLVSGALLKQVVILLIVFFMASLADSSIAYFNLAYQTADATNILLVAGFSGVGGSALATAFVSNNYERLAHTWRALIKVETLLVAPGLVFCLFNAPNIVHVLYGSKFDPAGPLLAVFLFFNILVRVSGMTIHQYSLYVIGKPKLVVLTQWISLMVVIGLGWALIPLFGPTGALIADGMGRLVASILLMVFLLPRLPRKYPLELLNFTLRFLLVLALAALPSLLWHPSSRVLLVVSGGLFIVLCLLLLVVSKPLSGTDLELIYELSPRIAPYLRVFTRKVRLLKSTGQSD